MPKVILTVGVSASGKSLWAYEECSKLGWHQLERDQERRKYLIDNGHMPADSAKYENLWRYYDFKKHEKHVDKNYQRKLDWFIKDRYNFIISDTNLNPKYRIPLIERLERNGYDVEIKEFHVDFDTAVKRDLKRRDVVGYTIICDQWKKWQTYLIENNKIKRYVCSSNAKLPLAVIVDLDGTVAKMDHRGPFELTKVDTDIPRDNVIRIVEDLHQQLSQHHVIFVSGREDSCRNLTQNWLAKNINTDSSRTKLFMRETGDTRKDSIVKEEIFWKEIADKYRVQYVIDDRKQVLRMWENIGIDTIINVGSIYEEF